MNVLIPAAGQGLRFIAAGYKEPKPFVRIAGKTMVQHVIDHAPNGEGLRMVALRPGYAFDYAVKNLAPSIFIHQVPVSDVALGTAGTVAHCAQMLPLDESVLVINSDNVIRPAMGWSNWLEMVNTYPRAGVAIVTWKVDRNDPAAESYSYVQDDNNSGMVRRVAEKEVIGPYACAGAFYFASAALLYTACRLEIEYGTLVQGEHYLAPAINQLIARGCNVIHAPLDLLNSVFVRIGTPEDLENAEEVLSE